MLNDTKIANWNSARLIAVSFICVILAGTFALRLPISTYDGIEIVDAVFVAVSAVCVTGLTTVDVAYLFTDFGKIVLLILIQVGGLGIMTLAAFTIWLVRQRISISDRMTLEYAFTQSETAFSLKDFIFFIFKYTIFAEVAGAIGFFFAFEAQLPISTRIFHSIFHSISSFCNAGFSLYPDNFIKFSHNISVNLITCFLIILGGIGFIVVFEIRNKLHYILRQKKYKYRINMFSLHTWLVLVTTASLIIGGTVLIFLLENTSGSQPITMLESFFQSVSCRTAGYNTVDIGSLHNSTLLIMTFLMFVGGSPGSTAGGIKTTTFAVLTCVIMLGKNNFEEVTAKGRTIPKSIVYQALLVFLFSITIVCVAVLLLTIFEPDLRLLPLLFEVVSGFGTVGYTTGITPELHTTSKWVLIFTMYAGRIGSLTIFSICMNREPSNIKYAEERILIG